MKTSKLILATLVLTVVCRTTCDSVMKTSKLVFATLVLTVVCKMKRKQKISCFFDKSLLDYVHSFLTMQDIFKNFFS
jgi:hypothetical protein